MATFLIICIFIIFVGIGIPDSILGSAWPAIILEFNVPLSFNSLITMVVAAGTMTSSFFSSKLINKFGVGKVCMFSTLLTASALLGFSFAPSIVWFFIFAVPSGLGAGAIDAGLNNYVALHYKPSLMSYLHCFYGIGVASSPFLMSIALSLFNNWRTGYKLVFAVQLFIFIISVIAMPMFNKDKNNEDKNEILKPINLSYKKLIKNSVVRTGWLIYFFSVALEFTCGAWACTYLVNSGMAKDIAAKFLTLYYIGMALGRFSSGLVSNKFKIKTIIIIGYSLVGLSLLIFILPLPLIVKGFALFFIGYGNGPTFPNFTYLTPSLFGKQFSQSVVSSYLFISNGAILVMPILFGLIGQYFSLNYFPYFLLFCFAVLLISTIVFFKYIKNKNRLQFKI